MTATHSPSSESLGVGCLVGLALVAVGFVAGLGVGAGLAWALMWARS